ncbi:MAG: ATP-binding protein, partial [Treponema sp.]|nr:ATP-binding protein [Treponema sp.]
LEKIPFDPHEIFVACRLMIMPNAIEKGLSMHFYAEPSIGKRLYGDPIKLHQVLVNLLSNAVKFTNTGAIKMLGTIKSIEANAVTMYFEIKDSGIGIAPEQIRKIFDPFMQAEVGTTRKYGGTGLGLVIAKNLIEMMGGRLCVESTPGVGSKFSFELTFDAIDNADKDDRADRIIFENTIEKPIFEAEILVCEDNIMNQQVVCEHLAQVGITTEIAHNGEEGVAMVEKRIKTGKKQYDLIFMDIHMPVMDGIEAAEKIFSLNVNIPIVAMTANVMTDDRNVYISMGMKDCMCKPFTSQVLWRCLVKYITPVKWDREEQKQREQADADLHQELINIFVKNCGEKFSEIEKALKADDIKLAHRIAHSLKGNAAQLNKTQLMKAAWEIENALKDGKNNTTASQLEKLQTELKKTITELEPLVIKKIRARVDNHEESLDDAAVHELLEKLEVTLRNGNPECLIYISDLQLLHGSEELIQQMEDFDFDSAQKTFIELKKNILDLSYAPNGAL